MNVPQVSGRAWKWVHFWAIFGFTALWVVAIFTGWIYSVEFVSHVSMVALVYAAVSSWQAARVEEKQDNLLEETSEDVEDLTERDCL